MSRDDVIARPEGSAGAELSDLAPDDAAPEDGRGPWLTLPAPQLLELLERTRERDSDRRKARRVLTERNVLLREGVGFARVKYAKDKDTDYSRPLKTWVPPGARSGTRLPSKADDLARKIVAQLGVDPPRPDVEPQPGDDHDPEAGAFAARWLEVSSGESGRGDTGKMEAALDAAMHAASGWVWLRPRQAGQYLPRPIKAFPYATTEADALTPNPEYPGSEPVVRYLRADGTLTDATADAVREWVPVLDSIVVDDACVTLLPVSAQHIAEADGVIVVACHPYSEWQAMYPDAVGQLTPEQIVAWAGWTPKDGDTLLPPSHRTEHDKAEVLVGGVPDPDLMLWGLHGYRRASVAYPTGAYVCATPVFVARGPWELTIEGPDGGQDVRPMDLPLVQVRPLVDALTGDPRGRAMLDVFGPADDVRQALWGGVLSHLDKLLNPMLLLDSMATGTVEEWTIRDGRPKFVPGLAQAAPVWEQVPSLPASVMQALDKVTGEMDTSSGLEQTAQGVQAPSVGSGKHAQMVIAQALVALGRASRDYNAAWQRLWRIALQGAQRWFTVPQRLAYVGEDGDVRERWFRGTDFGTVRDVTIKRGTGTLMSPEQKQQWVAMAQQYGWLDPADAVQLVRTNASTQTGWQESPHRHRILRELAAWESGPPEGWAPPPPQVDPQTGQPVPVADPANPFSARPNDEEPRVASVRHYELSRLIASTRYSRQPQAWRALVDAEYQRMAYAAGIQTVRQQYEAQQAAQQSAAQAEQAKAQQEQQATAQAEQAKVAERQASQASGAQQAQAIAGAVAQAVQPVAAAVVESAAQTQAVMGQAFGAVTEQLAAMAANPPVVQIAPPPPMPPMPAPVVHVAPPQVTVQGEARPRQWRVARRADGSLGVEAEP